MTRPTRRGFTMVELMIGLVLTLAVGGVVYQMLLRNTRVSRAQSERIGVQDNVRSGALIIANELREVGYDRISAGATAELGYAPLTPNRSDLLAIDPSFITYHATRGLGFVCQVTSGAGTIVVRSWQQLRNPKTTDTLMLYVENQANTASDDAWVHLGITATATQNCPDGAAGRSFTLQVPGPAAAEGLSLATALNAVDVGAPVRVSEVMRMQHFVDTDGKPYLGMRSISNGENTLQPVIGPLAANGGADPGLTFEFLDANGVATAVRANVRVIRFTLRGVTDQAVYGTKAHEATIDTLGLTTRVALRNTLR